MPLRPAAALFVAITQLALVAPAPLIGTAAAPVAGTAAAAGFPWRPERPQVPVDLHSETPPPSTYDLAAPHEDPAAQPLLAPENHALMYSVLRTLVSLALVIALIFLLSKLVLPRLIKNMGGARGTFVKVIERTALDGKHALVLVEVSGLRLLVGTGDSGVQLVAELPAGAPANFAQSMADLKGNPSTGSGTLPGSGGRNAKIN
jgi:flagellar biogenesis protein FliO